MALVSSTCWRLDIETWADEVCMPLSAVNTCHRAGNGLPLY